MSVGQNAGRTAVAVIVADDAHTDERTAGACLEQHLGAGPANRLVHGAAVTPHGGHV